jgi:alcohol dehydrogenase YqhD (iron-dependent ADH family)
LKKNNKEKEEENSQLSREQRKIVQTRKEYEKDAEYRAIDANNIVTNFLKKLGINIGMSKEDIIREDAEKEKDSLRKSFEALLGSLRVGVANGMLSIFQPLFDVLPYG